LALIADYEGEGEIALNNLKEFYLSILPLEKEKNNTSPRICPRHSGEKQILMTDRLNNCFPYIFSILRA